MAKILIVDDEKTMRESLSITFREKGDEVYEESSGEEAIKILGGKTFDLAFVDLKLKGMDGLGVLKSIKESNPLTEVVMITGHGTIENAVEAMKEGAYDYITKPFRSREILQVAEKALEKKALVDRVRFLEEQLREKYGFEEIIGKSSQMVDVMKLVSQVCDIDSTVLITGESGTGKELIARAIHFNSQRRDGPFVIINCAAIPENLQESELFGHVKGAFTDATRDRKGLLVEAHKGTLFLDEVVELAPSAQAKLLRFLQNGEVRQVGGNRTIHTDVRIISATNRDLKNDVQEGRFREDLFYRLNVIELNVPPLREREDDIELLVKHFLRKYSKKTKKGNIQISRRGLSGLLNYDWPGNVRELENVIERAVGLWSEGNIDLEDLPENLRKSGYPKSREGGTLADVEKEHIIEVLREAGGNRAKAARHLGIAPSTLWRKIKEYRIEK